jgi:hypothetical protein
VKLMAQVQTTYLHRVPNDSQNALTSTHVQVVLMLEIRETMLVHHVGADTMPPKQRCNFQALLHVAWLKRDDIDVAAARTPEAKGPVLLDEILD